MRDARSAYGACGKGFRREESGRMGSRDFVLVGLVVKRKSVNVAATIELVDELASQDDGRDVGHQIHGGLAEFPELAAVVPRIAVDGHPGIFVEIKAPPRHDVVRAGSKRSFEQRHVMTDECVDEDNS